MAKVEITVNKVIYPCRATMGAMLRFKKETGKEVAGMDATSLTEMCTFLWCCIVSASKADGIDFNMSLMDFADAISSDELVAWGEKMQANNAAADGTDDEKKS